VEEPRPGWEQVDEGELADDVAGPASGPRQEGAVGLQDASVGGDAQVAAGRALVQRLRVVDEQRLLERRLGRVVAGDVRPLS
jgi:hypothetical protein